MLSILFGFYRLLKIYLIKEHKLFYINDLISLHTEGTVRPHRKYLNSIICSLFSVNVLFCQLRTEHFSCLLVNPSTCGTWQPTSCRTSSNITDAILSKQSTFNSASTNKTITNNDCNLLINLNLCIITKRLDNSAQTDF